MKQRLGVNVDHVATLRQARRTRYPDPVTAAVIAELAGAGQVTIHLREDRRHIQERDLRILRESCQTLLNLEMAASEEMVRIACELKPDLVTLVPEKREELTTEGGLDVNGHRDVIDLAVKRLREKKIVVSLFIDPEPKQLQASRATGAERVEIHTGRYCDARGEVERIKELKRIVDAARLGAQIGLGVAAGHGLHYDNVGPIVEIREIDELNIGHAIVSRAVLVGMDRAVREMLERMER